jgi:hypothetical protein
MITDLRKRLSSPTDLSPLVRAKQLKDYLLYWIPVRRHPMGVEERAWLSLFLERVSDYLIGRQKMRSEVFLEYKTAYASLMDPFLDLAAELIPIMGFGYKPGVPLPATPTLEDLEPLKEGKFNVDDYVGDFIYWFLGKDERVERENFLGYGGMTIMYLAPDPASIPKKLPISPRLREHPMFKELFTRFDLDKINARAYALSDKWLRNSMELYGADIPKSPQTRGVSFIVPLLRSHDFFVEAERERLSKLCDFYVHESREDAGILIASHNDYEEALVEILEEMRERGLSYPGR